MKSRVLGLSLATFLAMTAAASAADVVADQGVLNVAPVTNQGVINSGGHAGDAFSASVGATGAAGQVSISNVHQPFPSLGSITANQDVRNDGAVSNVGSIGMGGVVGTGAAVTISAVGSVASAGSSNIGGIAATDIAAAQLSFNSGNVTNNGSIALEGGFGNAFATSITAVGAIAQASVTSINASNVANSLNVASTQQTVMNSGAVSNFGGIGAQAGAGNGSSLSISAVGAAASVSVSSIR